MVTYKLDPHIGKKCCIESDQLEGHKFYQYNIMYSSVAIRNRIDIYEKMIIGKGFGERQRVSEQAGKKNPDIEQIQHEHFPEREGGIPQRKLERIQPNLPNGSITT